ncbi:MAG: hypothetical protein IKH82_00800 [Clostridiales bacterium]|nr:hypothetical protein [Clostridiales bacterium]
MGKKILTILLMAAMVLAFTACGKKRSVSGMQLENAQFELNDYCATFPTCMGVGDKYICDVTKDGNPDLCTDVTFGSGMMRTAVVVYDVANEEFYVLDGYSTSYYIDRVENDKLYVIEGEKYDIEIEDSKVQPIPAGTTVTGVVKFKKGELYFVPNK